MIFGCEVWPVKGAWLVKEIHCVNLAENNFVRLTGDIFYFQLSGLASVHTRMYFSHEGLGAYNPSGLPLGPFNHRPSQYLQQKACGGNSFFFYHL